LESLGGEAASEIWPGSVMTRRRPQPKSTHLAIGGMTDLDHEKGHVGDAPRGGMDEEDIR